MSISELVEKGSLKLQKVDGKYQILFSGYKEYGLVTKHKFEGRNLKIAYDKLMEYLNNSR